MAVSDSKIVQVFSRSSFAFFASLMALLLSLFNIQVVKNAVWTTYVTQGPAGVVGQYPSMKLDSSGYPVISHYNSLNGDLLLTHCNDAACTGGNETTSTVDSTGNVGQYTSLALDTSGYPVISYYDVTNANLKVTHCNDANCAGSNETTTAVASTGDVGSHTSIKLDTSGYPVISYYDDTNDDLKLVHCNDADCAGNNETTNTLDSTGSVGQYTSLVLDASGYPVISYYDVTNTSLKTIHCNDVNCAGSNETTNTLDSEGTTGKYSSLVLDASGYPVVAYNANENGADGTLKLVHCNDVNCSGSNEIFNAIDTYYVAGSYTSLALDASGYPVISYSNTYSDELRVVHCNDVNCGYGDETYNVIDANGIIGNYNSMVLDSNGYPVIAYTDGTRGDLKVVHCDDANCSQGNETANVATQIQDQPRDISMAVNSSGLPIIAYYDQAIRKMEILMCGDANCMGFDESYAIPDSTATSGQYPSVQINASNYPVVTYYDAANSRNHLINCDDASCASESVIDIGRTLSIGNYNSFVRDGSGYPVISYYDATDANLKLVHCNDALCIGSDDTISTVDSTGDVGQYTSLVLDGSGYPVISYYDVTNGNLKLTHCNDVNCAGSNETTNAVDSTGDVGQYTSLRLDGSGYPVIAYYDVTNADLKVTHCNDVDCAGANENTNTVDSSGDVGQFISMRLDASGYPVMSYRDISNNDLKVAHCNDVNCNGGDETTKTVDSTGNVGKYTSMQLNASGYPVISYVDQSNNNLKVALCNDANCDSAAGGGPTINAVNNSIAVSGGSTAVTYDSLGYPVIAYYDGDDTGTLKLMHCNDVNCSGGNENDNTVASVSAAWISVVLDSLGYPVISYQNTSTRALTLVHCNDVNCAGSNETSNTIAAGSTYASLVLDASGNPVLSYWANESTTQDLALTHCNDANCAGGDENTNTIDSDGSVGLVTSLRLDTSGYPVISYSDGTNGDLKLAHCNDVNCAGLNENINTVDSLGNVGERTVLRLDGIGYPVIAYYGDYTTNALVKITHCNDANCAGLDETASTVYTNTTGLSAMAQLSMSLDGSGYPVIGHYDFSSLDAKVTHCNDANCAGSNETTNTIDSTGDVGSYISMVLDGAGKPILAYKDITNSDLKTAHCSDANCSTSSADTVNTVISMGPTGAATSLVLDASEYPVITYFDGSSNYYKLVHCTDTSCSVDSVTGPDTTNSSAIYQSAVLDSSGYPVVAYISNMSSLKLMHCNDAKCAGNDETINTAASTAMFGQYVSLALDSSGYPVISYNDMMNADLMLVHCNDVNCAGSNETTSTVDSSGSVGDYSSLKLDSSGYPVISYYKDGSSDLKLAHCNDADCAGSNESLVEVDTGGNTGTYTSLHLDGSGYPVIAYLGSSNNLTLAHCNNANCDTSNVNSIESSSGYTSLKLDSSGYPVISHLDNTSNLKLVHCTNANCSAPIGYNSNSVASSSGYTSLQLDSSGYPVISHIASSLPTIVHCNDANCAGANETTNTLESSSTFVYSSLQLDSSGYPVLAYQNSMTGYTRVAYCNDANCAGGTTLTANNIGNDALGTALSASIALDGNGYPVVVYSASGALLVGQCADANCTSITSGPNTVDPVSGTAQYLGGYYNALALDTSYYPVIAFYHPTNGDLGLIHCTDTLCSGSDENYNVVDSTGDVGKYISIVLDASGYPVMSYYDVTNANLKIAHCSDVNCAASTINNVDTTGDVGQYTSIKLDASGYPVISYYDVTNGDLKVAHCSNANCSASTINNVDTTGDVGQYTSLRLDTSGYPVIGYYDVTNGNSKVTHCNDVNCAEANKTTSVVESSNNVGTYANLALDSNGYPIVAYGDTSTGKIKLAHCNDASCSGSNEMVHVASSVYPLDVHDSSTVLDSSGYPVTVFYTNDELRLMHCNDTACAGADEASNSLAYLGSITDVYPSVVLDASGYPVVSYRDATSTVKITHCNDVNCAGSNETTNSVVGGAGGIGQSFVLDANGYPVIAFPNTSNYLAITHCSDANCAATTTNTVDTNTDVGRYPSLRLDASGYPVISYYDVTNGDLKVAHCSNANCTAKTLSTVDSTGDVGKYPSLRLDTSGYPVVSYYDVTNASLKTVHCNDAYCSNSDETINTVDSTETLGNLYTSLALDASGYPVIAYGYAQASDNRVKLAHCNDVNCSGNNETIVVADQTAFLYLFSLSLNLAPTTYYPVLTYSTQYEVSPGIKVLKCDDANCSPGQNTETINTADDILPDLGQYASIALDSNGYPVVSYYDNGNGDLKVMHCNDLQCSGNNETVNTVDSTGDVGQYTSIALDGSGYPVISYYYVTGTDLKVAHCNDVNCAGSNETTNTVNSTGTIGLYTSIALDSSGYPVISYYDSTNGDLKLTHCNDVNCGGSDETTTSVATASTIGQYTSLKLDSSGYPVISYYDATGGDLEFTHCGNANCSSGNTSNTIDSDDNVGQYTSLALDSSGYPVVSYYDVTNADLLVAHCNDANCANSDESISQADTSGDVGQYTSIVLDASGYPMISYFDNTNGDLKIIRCNDINCGPNEVPSTPDTTYAAGSYTSIKLDSTGKPVISYSNISGGLVLLHCGDASCSASNSINTAYTATNLRDTSLELDSSSYPVVTHFDDNNNDILLTHCNDANCAGTNETTNVVDASGGANTSAYNSMKLDASGNPVIAYYVGANLTDGTLKLAHCDDPNCAYGTPNNINNPETSAAGVVFTDTVLDASGFPVVAYGSSASGRLRLMHCNDVNCAGGDDTANTVDSTTATMQYPSLVLDSSGFPVISYYNSSTGDLKLAHCNDANCAGANETVNTVDSTNTVGQYTSLVLDSSGFPMISYYDATGFDLEYAHCTDVNCTNAATKTTIESTNTVGSYTSITKNSSGNPVIAYYHGTNAELKLVVCGNANCSSGNTTTVVDTTTSIAVGTDLSLILNPSTGYPVISYYDTTNLNLMVAVCSTATCSSVTKTTIDSTGTVGQYTSIALDSNNYPVISYYDGTNLDLKVVHCSNSTCSSKTISTVDSPVSGATVGLYTSMALDSSGYPIVAYYDSTNSDVKVVHCANANCTNNGADPINTVDSTAGSGTYPSLQLDNSGYPVISYHDSSASTNGLKLVHCNDVNCAGANETISRIDTGVNNGLYTSFAFDSNRYPVIAYYDLTNGDLKLAHCNDVNCAGSNETVSTIDSTGTVGLYTAVALDSNGYPVISYYDSTNTNLKLAHCNDVDCAGSNETKTNVDFKGNVGEYNSLALDASGYPVISHMKNLGGGSTDLRFVHCNDANCAGGTETVETINNSENTVGRYTSIKRNGDMAIVAYEGVGLNVSSVDLISPVALATANLVSQPHAGDTTVNISGSFTENNPGTNAYYLAVGTTTYGTAYSGPSNTATPGIVAVPVGATLDGDDHILKLKIVHTDDGGNQVTNENLTPVNAYQYVFPYNATLVQVSATSNAYNLRLQPNGAEASTVQYAIGISLSRFAQDDIQYIQPSGILSAAPYWGTYADWGGTSGFVINELIGSSISFGVKARNPNGPTNTETAWHSTQSPRFIFGSIGGSVSGGGVSSATTQTTQQQQTTTQTQQETALQQTTPSADIQGTSTIPQSPLQQPVVVLRAEDLADIGTLKTADKNNIIKMVNLMLDNNTYTIPVNKRYGPSVAVDAAFGIRVASIVSGTCCFEDTKYPGYSKLRGAAIEGGLIPANLQPSAKLTRADFYGLLLKSMGVKMGKGTVKALREECSDFKSNDINTAKIFFTAYKYGLVSKYAGNRCRLNMKFSRAEAAKWALRALKAKAKLK